MQNSPRSKIKDRSEPEPRPVPAEKKPEPASRRAVLNPADVVDFISHSATQSLRTGAMLGQLAQAGDIFQLAGELGAGKTTLTKGIADGLGIEGYVNSPTFTLVNEYQGRLPLYHLDCYRLESGREALDFGIEEYLYGDGLTVIEWPERIAEVLPAEGLTVRLTYLSDTKRGIRLEPVGTRYVALVAEFKKQAFRINQ